MARPPSGQEHVKRAKQAIADARTVEELRRAQAVVLPLEYGLTLPQTAEVIGVGTSWACRLRREFMLIASGQKKPKQPRGGRRRENLTAQQEQEFLQPFVDQAQGGGVLIVSAIRQALEQRLGRGVALSSVYNLLHRHSWRKLAPDKRHPQADVAAQADWKKNSRISSPKRGRKSPAKGRSG